MKQVIKEKQKVAVYDPCEAHDDWYADDFREEFNQAELKGSFYVVDAKNVDWRGASGIAICNDWDRVLEVICIGNDYRIELSKGEGKNTLDGVTYHHDCPTGTYYTIMSGHKAFSDGLICRETYKEYN